MATSTTKNKRTSMRSRTLLFIRYKALAVLTCCLLLTLSGCKKDDVIPPADDPVVTTGTTRIFGTVLDRSGLKVAGAMISAGGQTTLSDASGMFLLSGVSVGDRAFVRAEKGGYFPGSEGTIVRSGVVTRVSITMIANAPQFSFPNSAGHAAYLPNGAGVQFIPNSIADAQGQPYFGNVHAAIVHLDPDGVDFSAVTPGADLLGTNADGERMLTSYGMLMVQLTDDNGNELSLSAGQTAELSFPVSVSQSGSAPASMPLWHFNESTGIWEEEGSAALAGGTYVGTVSHFSSWNADIPGDRGRVHGLVLDCNGDPLEGVRVSIGQTEAVTGASGIYERYVPTGVSFDVEVSEPSLGLQSSVIPVPPLSNGQELSLGAISVNCPAYVSLSISCTTGNLSWGVILADWGTGDVAINYAAAGTYQIAVPSNGGSATIRVLLPNGTTLVQNVTLPTSAGQSVSIGNFDVCPSGTSGSFTGGFTLNGDGFTNTPFTLTANSLTAFASYTLSDDGTVGFMSGSATTSLSFGFPGNITSSWAVVNGNGDGFMSVNVNGSSYFMDNGTLNITAYGAVGGTISGNFAGQFVRYDMVTFDPYYVTVSNGTFSVHRAPDEP